MYHRGKALLSSQSKSGALRRASPGSVPFSPVSPHGARDVRRAPFLRGEGLRLCLRRPDALSMPRRRAVMREDARQKNIKNAQTAARRVVSGRRLWYNMACYGYDERKDPPQHPFAASLSRRADRGDLLVALARLRHGDDAGDPQRRVPLADRPGAFVHGAVHLLRRQLRGGALSWHGTADGAAAPAQVPPHRIFLQRHHPFLQRRTALRGAVHAL